MRGSLAVSLPGHSCGRELVSPAADRSSLELARNFAHLEDFQSVTFSQIIVVPKCQTALIAVLDLPDIIFEPF
jgi:hypothetical protein